MNDSELLDTAKKVTTQSFKLAEDYFSKTFSQPSITLNQRGKIAGSAHLQKNIIKLNRQLFVNNFKDFVQQVIPHEAAHLICYQQFGKVKPHGSEWQSVMLKIFKLEPAVTHKFDVASVGMREFSYRCDCTPLIKLSAIRHNKVKRGAQQYRCQKCRTILVPS
jgi:SprT protein